MIKIVILLIVTYIFNIVDYLQTSYAIQRFGLGIEANPVVCFLFEHNCAWVVKIIVLPILMIILGFLIKLERRCGWVVYALAILYFLVIMHNFANFIIMGII